MAFAATVVDFVAVGLVVVACKDLFECFRGKGLSGRSVVDMGSILLFVKVESMLDIDLTKQVCM